MTSLQDSARECECLPCREATYLESHIWARYLMIEDDRMLALHEDVVIFFVFDSFYFRPKWGYKAIEELQSKRVFPF